MNDQTWRLRKREHQGGDPSAAPQSGFAQDDRVGGVASYGEPQEILGQMGTSGLLGTANPTEIGAGEPAIGREQVQEAMQTLLKFKSGKASLDAQIVANEQWYKLRHWEMMRKPRRDADGKLIEDEIEPSSAWLFNAIANKHADAMDNFPRPNVLPREAGDVSEAKILSSILPPLLDQCGFEKTYSDEQYYKLKHGAGVFGVFWDAAASNGLGEIAIRRVDLINLFWEPGITDIQESSDMFLVKLESNKVLEARYPQLRGKLGAKDVTVAEYIHDDSISTEEKTAVVDWYYKRTENGRTVLHFCKFAGLEVLYATENDPSWASRGLYDHGKYPFVFDVLFPLEGTPVGFGYIAVGKSPQEYIDRGDQAVLENTLDGATPRWWVPDGAGVNEDELADRKKKMVHYTGSGDGIKPMETKSLPSIYVSVKEGKINELKEVTGTMDVTTGSTSGGLTAASAIAALQEAGGKTSRDAGKGSYRAFRGVIELVIELIRQFYELPHYFRIVGEGGQMEFERYTNAGLVPQISGVGTDGAPVYRIPVFDIEISAEKQSPYSRLAQNEMALQFYNAGFFAPQNADAALACLDMMDFDRKDMILQKIAQNGTIYQQLQAMQQVALQLAQAIDQAYGTQYTQQIAAFIQQSAQGMQGGGLSASALARSASGTASGSGESHVTRKARERAAATTEV